MDNRVKILIGFAVLLAAVVIVVAVGGGGDDDEDSGGGSGGDATELEIEVLEEGSGPEAAGGRHAPDPLHRDAARRRDRVRLQRRWRRARPAGHARPGRRHPRLRAGARGSQGGREAQDHDPVGPRLRRAGPASDHPARRRPRVRDRGRVDRRRRRRRRPGRAAPVAPSPVDLSCARRWIAPAALEGQAPAVGLDQLGDLRLGAPGALPVELRSRRPCLSSGSEISHSRSMPSAVVKSVWSPIIASRIRRS